jgi:hypothetical protein
MLCAPRLVDGAARLGRAALGIDEESAWLKSPELAGNA